MRVLAIDTAGPVVGAALVSPDGAREWSARVVQGADAQLLPAIASLLGGERVDLLTVSVGPGAFTGLRVGVSAALGLAVALGVPVLPQSSLRARAALVQGPRVLAALDAKKQRLYAGLFDCTGPVPLALSPEVDLPPGQVWPDAPFDAVGEGAMVMAEAVAARGGRLVEAADRCPVLALGRLATLLAHEAVPADEIALRYLRPADAKPPPGVLPSA